MGVITPRWPHTTVVGDILDISEAGISLRYVGEEVMANSSRELVIVAASPRFFLPNIPIKTITDTAMEPMDYEPVAPRRIGAKFLDLTPIQASDIKTFLSRYSATQV